MPAQQEEDIVGWLLVVELQCVDHQTLSVPTALQASIRNYLHCYPTITFLRQIRSTFKGFLKDQHLDYNIIKV